MDLDLNTANINLTARFGHHHRAHRQGLHIQRRPQRARPQRQANFVGQATTKVFNRRASLSIRIYNRQAPLQPVLQRNMRIRHNFNITIRVRRRIDTTNITRRSTLRTLRLAHYQQRYNRHVTRNLTSRASVNIHVVTRAPIRHDNRQHTRFSRIAIRVLTTTNLRAPLIVTLRRLARTRQVNRQRRFSRAIRRTLHFRFNRTLLRLPHNTRTQRFVNIRTNLGMNLTLTFTRTGCQGPTLTTRITPQRTVISTFRVDTSTKPSDPTDNTQPI